MYIVFAQYEEEGGLTSGSEENTMQGYLAAYKSFSEDFTSMLKLVLGEPLTTESSGQLHNMIEALKQQLSL